MNSGESFFHPVSARRALVTGPFSAVLLMASSASGGKLSLVEHPLAPRALGSPMHPTAARTSIPTSLPVRSVLRSATR